MQLEQGMAATESVLPVDPSTADYRGVNRRGQLMRELIAMAVVLAAVTVFGRFAPLNTEAANPAITLASTRSQALCAISLDDAVSAKAEMDRLVAQGKVILLPQHVDLGVLVQGEAEGESHVQILAGPHIGETCWISTQSIKPETR